MSRKAKGSIKRTATELKVRVTIKDDHGETYRPWISLDPKLKDDVARRIALRAAALQNGKPRPRVVHVGGIGPTCDEYFEKLWAPSRAGKVKTLRDDCGRWKNHLRELIGQKPIADITADDLRAAVEALDAKAADPAVPYFNKKSAVNCWTVVTKMFDDACNSKQSKLRLLKVNPALGVQPPDPPGEVEKQWLFPVELRQLLACEAVPLERRRLYAMATYCYTRPGEVFALFWRSGVDLDHSMVRINRAWDSREDRYNEYTKTGDSRHFALEPILRPMLEAMFQRRQAEHLFKPQSNNLARTLRADLLRAGVDRPALHVPKPGAELMRFHDLRATGITYMAMRGDTDNAIRERAGHTDFQTTQLYIRRGHLSAGSTIGDPFAPLPSSLLGIVPESSQASDEECGSGVFYLGSLAEREGFEPSVRLPVHMISSHAPSASRSPLLRPSASR